MRLALLLLAGCWTGEPAVPHSPAPVTYGFRIEDGTHQTWWHVTITGDHFRLVHDGVAQTGTVAPGPRAMDLRGTDGTLLLACHWHTVDVHPVNAELTVACTRDPARAIPTWSQPAAPREGWVCMQHGLLARVDLVLVENATVEGLVRTCWDYDHATSSYLGYRAGR